MNTQVLRTHNSTHRKTNKQEELLVSQQVTWSRITHDEAGQQYWQPYNQLLHVAWTVIGSGVYLFTYFQLTEFGYILHKIIL